MLLHPQFVRRFCLRLCQWLQRSLLLYHGLLLGLLLCLRQRCLRLCNWLPRCMLLCPLRLRCFRLSCVLLHRLLGEWRLCCRRMPGFLLLHRLLLRRMRPYEFLCRWLLRCLWLWQWLLCRLLLCERLLRCMLGKGRLGCVRLHRLLFWRAMFRHLLGCCGMRYRWGLYHLLQALRSVLLCRLLLCE